MLLRVSFRFTFLNSLSWSDGIFFLYMFPGNLQNENKNIICVMIVILGYDPTYSTFGSSSCGFAGGSSIESCAPGERGFGIRYGVITPNATGFQHP